MSVMSVDLGGLLGCLGGVLEASWGRLGASWGRLGASWRPRPNKSEGELFFEGLLGPSWGRLGANKSIITRMSWFIR